MAIWLSGVTSFLFFILFMIFMYVCRLYIIHLVIIFPSEGEYKGLPLYHYFKLLFRRKGSFWNQSFRQSRSKNTNRTKALKELNSRYLTPATD